MKNVTKTIDVNAHIANINSQITIENGISKAVISFSNLGYGIITAVKFKRNKVRNPTGFRRWDE